MRFVRAAVMVAALALTATASAQQGARRQIIFYSEPNYEGDSLTISQERDRIQLGWQIRSMRMPEGDRWLVCPRPKFAGNGEIVIKSQPSIRMFVGSARPRKNADLPPPPLRPADAETSPDTHPGPSLRGSNAEFFSAPMIDGEQAIACDSGGESCTEESADRFCRAQGWSGAVYQRQEQAGGRNVLVDVLCTRSGD